MPWGGGACKVRRGTWASHVATRWRGSRVHCERASLMHVAVYRSSVFGSLFSFFLALYAVGKGGAHTSQDTIMANGHKK